MANDRKQVGFRYPHLKRVHVLLSPSFQTIHIFPPLLPALLGGLFVADLPPDPLQGSVFQLVKQKDEQWGNVTENCKDDENRFTC